MSSIGERLREERSRAGINQTDFGAIGGVSRRTQAAYEADEQSPTAAYLSAVVHLGVDVSYVITGVRGGEVLPAYTKDEVGVIRLWREASPDTRAVAVRILRS